VSGELDGAICDIKERAGGRRKMPMDFTFLRKAGRNRDGIPNACQIIIN